MSKVYTLRDPDKPCPQCRKAEPDCDCERCPQCGDLLYEDRTPCELCRGDGAGQWEELGAIHVGNALEILPTLPAGAARCCVTSPPYWGLRDDGCAGQLGLEKTPEEYTAALVAVFREVRRVLADDGTLWLNLGDSYAAGGMANPSAKSTLGGGKDRGAADYQLQRTPPPGLKPKDLVGIPWRVAFALQADGWCLRSDIIWAKPNPMPESVTDRPTKAHEYLFLLSKSARYYYDAAAVAERAILGPHVRDRLSNFKKAGFESFAGHHVGAPTIVYDGTRNKRTVWTIATQPYPGAHFAVMPPKLVEPCILAGSEVGDAVLDPFAGTATVGVVSKQHGREFVGVELSPGYAELAEKRLAQEAGQALLFTPAGEKLYDVAR